jgi:hypothetical protein
VKPETIPEAILVHVRSDEELAWRARRMTQLGADEALAAKAAASNLDLHAFERLLKDGCPIDLAWSIAQPLAEPVSPDAQRRQAPVAAAEGAAADD